MRDEIHKSGLPFMKMHGLGNDFVILDSRGRAPLCSANLARALADRHTGVGFDQLAEMTDSPHADLHLAFWNSDGSQANACGNATRSVAQHVMGKTNADHLSIETARGILLAEMTPEGPSVSMGLPQTDWREIPLAHEVDTLALPLEGAPVAVGMGNPHAVFFVDNADGVDPSEHGPTVENDPLFPNGTNVEFATARTRSDVRMRVWERGTGITRACGSGACATLVAGHLSGLLERKVRMELDGGWLSLDWRDDGVWMTGPTVHVFDGHLTSEFLDSIT